MCIRDRVGNEAQQGKRTQHQLRQFCQAQFNAGAAPLQGCGDVGDDTVDVCRLRRLTLGIAGKIEELANDCLLYTSPSPRDRTRYRMPSSA